MNKNIKNKQDVIQEEKVAILDFEQTRTQTVSGGGRSRVSKYHLAFTHFLMKLSPACPDYDYDEWRGACEKEEAVIRPVCHHSLSESFLQGFLRIFLSSKYSFLDV